MPRLRTNATSRDWYSYPKARRWRCAEPPQGPEDFHRSLPNYQCSPLVNLPGLAQELQVGRVFVKDESERLGLPSFKILGASWAIARVVSTLDDSDGVHPRRHRHAVQGLEAQRKLVAEFGPVTLVTATDGNHGRAVARTARLIGARARVFAPDTVPSRALALIEQEGAEVIVLSYDYDTTVQQAAENSATDSHAILVQDTSWPGYKEIPQWIVDGYSTLFREIDAQLSQASAQPLALLAVPTGVGSLLEAAVSFYRSGDAQPPAIFAIEPRVAACVTTSLKRRRFTSVSTGFTRMAGLNCGTPSAIAWSTILSGVDAAIVVDDDEAELASHDLMSLGISAGPCGAASLAGLRAALGEDVDDERRRCLGLDDRSTVVLLSTEGRDPS